MGKSILDSERWGVETLAAWGMSGRTIARNKYRCRCAVWNGTCSHIRRVYKICKDAGIKLRDYSQGKTLEAKSILKVKRRKAG